MTLLHQRWEKAPRYYQVDVCQDMWGQWVLIQRWGRRGTALGQTQRTACTGWRKSSGGASSAVIAPSVDLL